MSRGRSGSGAEVSVIRFEYTNPLELLSIFLVGCIPLLFSYDTQRKPIFILESESELE